MAAILKKDTVNLIAKKSKTLTKSSAFFVKRKERPNTTEVTVPHNATFKVVLPINPPFLLNKKWLSRLINKSILSYTVLKETAFYVNNTLYHTL